MTRALLLLLCIAVQFVVHSTFAIAQPSSSVEDQRPPVFDLGNLGIDESPESTVLETPNNINIGGYVQQTGAYSYEADSFKFSKFQTSFDLNLSGNITDTTKLKLDALASYDTAYNIEGRQEFSSETLDTYESDARLLEGYLDIDFTNWFNVRLGRQYFSWGESLSAQISDIGNSRDFRLLGLQDVEDSRLSVGSSKVTFYGNSWEYNLIALHEFRPHEMGAKGSVYDPFLAARNSGVNILKGDDPDNLKDPELLTRLYFSTAIGDFSFFFGNTYNDFPVFSVNNYDPGLARIEYIPLYEKYKRFGSFGNIIVGSWLFKYDIARSLDKPFNRSGSNIAGQIQRGDNPIVGTINSNYTQAMLGVEYSGLSETLISAEVYHESIDNYVPNVFQDKKHSTEVSLYISRDFYNDRMISTLWTNFLLDRDAIMFRLDTTYDVNDHLQLRAAITGINSSDKESYFFDYRKTDRIELSIKYQF